MAIIGAGVAGLQVAKLLKKVDIECTIFEKTDDVAGVWRKNYGTSHFVCLFERLTDLFDDASAPRYLVHLAQRTLRCRFPRNCMNFQAIRGPRTRTCSQQDPLSPTTFRSLLARVTCTTT